MMENCDFLKEYNKYSSIDRNCVNICSTKKNKNEDKPPTRNSLPEIFSETLEATNSIQLKPIKQKPRKYLSDVKLSSFFLKISDVSENSRFFRKNKAKKLRQKAKRKDLTSNVNTCNNQITCHADPFLKKFSTRSVSEIHRFNNQYASVNQEPDKLSDQYEVADDSESTSEKWNKYDGKINNKKYSNNDNDTKINRPNQIQDNKQEIDFKNKKSKTKSSLSYLNSLENLFNKFVINPDEDFMFSWLILLTICILYNLWIIIARQSFEELQIRMEKYWLTIDVISDLVYILDIVVQLRTGYLEQGLLVYDAKKLAINYLNSRKFIADIVSLLPFDLIQLKIGYKIPILRFPRFLKAYRAIQLYYLQESRTLYPNVWRVANLTHILFLLGHWFASFYFIISKAEGFKGQWLYPQPTGEYAKLSRMYLRSLYWAVLTLTTIGDLPRPESNFQ